MIPCSKNHVPIWHEERFCPLCTVLSLLVVERMHIDKLKEVIKEHQHTIDQVFGWDENK